MAILDRESQITKLFIFGIFFFTIIYYANAASVSGIKAETVKVDFKKVSSTDTIMGTFYIFDNKMVSYVKYPVLQIMVIDSLQTLIYYPNEKTALFYKRTTSAIMPLFNMFLSFFYDRQFLSEINFILISSQKKDDTLITSWSTNNKKKKLTFTADMAFYNDKPLYCKTYNYKKDLTNKIDFFDYIIINGHDVPMKIQSTATENKKIFNESIQFTNPSINQPVPKEIKEFHVPAQTLVKEIKW
ncbi:MAG TPA: hypothetical protein DCO75_12650 [Fibrobacteres bacterium]|nr:hypothetical protein [Fibrobacterota bacterium]